EALREGDRYLLCSDGLMKELGREDIERILMQTPGSPLEAAQALVDAACKAGGRDNVTVLVIDFQDPSVE
ncbi:MAG: serine/threonine-protein phosphatase, partial [Chromatiaceae bacterium]|nr:serine/threonine-protein phosphatase [Chromatiaceae bacterium]